MEGGAGGSNVTITLRADNVAALALSKKLSSTSPVLNFLGAELSLLLEEMEVEELAPGHIYGAANQVADALSRLAAPDCSMFPPEAIAAKKKDCPLRNRAFYQLPPPIKAANIQDFEHTQSLNDEGAPACPWASRWSQWVIH